jgi:hypothetical protein
MANMSDELKERNILKLILIVRFACATLNLGHPIGCAGEFADPFQLAPDPAAMGLPER